MVLNVSMRRIERCEGRHWVAVAGDHMDSFWMARALRKERRWNWPAARRGCHFSARQAWKVCARSIQRKRQALAGVGFPGGVRSGTGLPRHSARLWSISPFQQTRS